MSGIAKLLDQTVVLIDSKIQAGEVPTPEIIAFILRDTTAKANAVVVKDALPAVKKLLVDGYQSIGWDFVRNRSSSTDPPTIDQVKDLSHTLSARIRAWVEEQESALEPTPEELDSVAEACNRLWQLDFNRIKPENGDYRINLQEGKSFGDQRDVARQPLFEFVRPEVLKQPTFASFAALLDNYTAQVGQNEVVTRQESGENARFINAIYSTHCIKYLHRYLVMKRLAPESPEQFKQMLHDVWFQIYGRSRGVKDSSGFEHVFVGEIKAGKVVGLHNWIQIYMQEKAGRFDYKGYVRSRVKGGRSIEHEEDEQLLSINFEWDRVSKDASTIFVGTSPEFEIALYTLIFLTMGEEQVAVTLGPYRAEITCYKWNMQGKNFVGSSFPGLPPSSPDEAATKIQAGFRGMQSRRVYE